MNSKSVIWKNLLLCASIALNIALGGTLFVTRFNTSFDYDNTDFEKTAAANIVSAPSESTVIFNPVEITLKKGESAAIQYAVMFRQKQLNWIAETLYDKDVVRVTKNPFGITITALAPGDAVLQTLTEDGIKDVAHVKVIENSRN